MTEDLLAPILSLATLFGSPCAPMTLSKKLFSDQVHIDRKAYRFEIEDAKLSRARASQFTRLPVDIVNATEPVDDT